MKKAYSRAKLKDPISNLSKLMMSIKKKKLENKLA